MSSAPFAAIVSVLPDHSASCMEGWVLLSFEHDMLTLNTSSEHDALLAIHSNLPLSIQSVSGGSAALVPGWDGSIGYSHYGLQLSADEHADVMTVQLIRHMPPEQIIESSESDVAAFGDQLTHRPSRFPDAPEAFASWKKTYAEKLTRTLTGGSWPERCLRQPQLVTSQSFPEFTLHWVTYYPTATRENSLLLSLPHASATTGATSADARVPLLLALHGHEAPWGEADDKAFTMGHHDEFMAWFAARGWAVLQPATMDHTLHDHGGTLQGEWAWNAMTALDYALQDERIDPARVAACGLSTGGHVAMSMLALDDRIRAGVIGCVFSTWHHYQTRMRIPPHCDCGITHQLAPVLEQCDWAALSAPKPMMFHHGRKDASFCPDGNPACLKLDWNTGLMPQAEYDATFAEVQRAWATAGNPDGAIMHMHDDGHHVDHAAAMAWLENIFSAS